MVFSEKNRFIFFAAGKTGTSSIEEILQHYGEELPFDLGPDVHPKHAPPRIVRQKLGEDAWSTFFKFAFVRNPWDWVISNYFWNIRSNETRLCRWLRSFGLVWKINTFREKHFWRHMETMKQYTRGTHPENRFQFSFLSDEAGTLLVDFVGRYERLQEDFDTVCDRIGIPRAHLPHRNRGCCRGKTVTEIYTDRTRKLVAENYRKDIEFFGYRYGA